MAAYTYDSYSHRTINIENKMARMYKMAYITKKNEIYINENENQAHKFLENILKNERAQ